MVTKLAAKEIGGLRDQERTGVEEQGNHRFPRGRGSQLSWEPDHPKKDRDGFAKVDEDAKLPFE